MHSIRMLRPRLEMIFVNGEFLRERFDMRWVFVEENLHHTHTHTHTSVHPFNAMQITIMCRTNRPNPILHPLQLRQRMTPPHLLRHRPRLDQLPEGVDHEIPQLLVLLVQQHDQPRGLRVEGAGDVVDGGVDQVFDLGVRDRGVFAEFVDGAPVLGEFDQSTWGVSHFLGGGLGFGCC